MAGAAEIGSAGVAATVARLRVAWPAVLPGLQYGLRVWASVSLALLIAFWMQLDNPYWAATSAAIVCQPSLGTTLRKGWFRAVGTLVGAVAIVALTAAFPQSRAGLLIGLTLWGALCGFLATVFRNFASYAAALAGYTAAIVFADTIAAPNQAFNFAVARATEINLGIVSAGVVLAVTDFGDARRRLAQALADVAQSIAVGLAATLAAGMEAQAERMIRRDLIRRVIALDATVDEALGEASDLRARSPALQAAVEGLFMALSAWREIGSHLNALSQDGNGAVVAAPLLDHARRVGFSWLQDAVAMRETCGDERHAVLAIAAPDLSMHILIGAVADALAALRHAANGLVLLTAPGQEWPERGSKRLHVPDVLPAIINALRVVLVLAVAEFGWIETNWSGGQTMVIFAAVAVILFSPRAEEAYTTAAGFAVGTVATVPVAAVVNFAILPAQQTFAGLSLVLAAVLVPLSAMSAGTWRKTTFVAMVANFVPLLAPANLPVYDPGQFFNSALAIVSGVIVAMVGLRVFPPISPSWRIRRLLGLTLRDLTRLAVRPRWLDNPSWVGRISQRLAALPVQATPEQAAPAAGRVLRRPGGDPPARAARPPDRTGGAGSRTRPPGRGRHRRHARLAGPLRRPAFNRCGQGGSGRHARRRRRRGDQ